jgi:4-hydroxy-tetrahydrodipicolinate synthase
VPAEMSRMVRAALRNEWTIAREIERKYARLFEANFWESNPAPAKMILSLMGRCNATVRLPMVQPDRAMRQKLERLAGELGLLREAIPEGDMRMF